MIWFKKAQKIDIIRIIDYKLYTILPFVNKDKEKLKVIADVNTLMLENYNKVKLIYKNFRVIGAYLINNKIIDFIYIEKDYQKYYLKILKKIKVKKIKVVKKNEEFLKLLKNNGYKMIDEEGHYLILEGE